MVTSGLEVDSDLEREFELEFADDSESDEDVGQEFGDPDRGWEVVDQEDGVDAGDPFAERLMELAQREYESESAMDEVLSPLLNEMEREYFFKGLLNKVKSAGKRFLHKGIGQLGKYVKGKFPAISAITQLARGNLKGLLGPLAKSALSFVPGGGVALPALQALGFEVSLPADAQQTFWNNYVTLTREAYANLASDLNESADDHEEASRLATGAFKKAYRQVTVPGHGATGAGKVRRIQVRRGERILIEVV